MMSNPAVSKLAVNFVLERETKGAVRYQEVDDQGWPVELALAKVGTLYIRKTAFDRGTKPPNRLTVTVEPIE